MARMKWKTRRGVSIVESAFIIPIMMLLVFGAIEFGSLLHIRHNMLHAARGASRVLAVQGGTPSQAIQVAQELLPQGNLDFEIQAIVPQNTEVSRDVTVSISVPFREAALGDMFGFYGDRRMSVQVTMRSEQ